MLVRVKLFGPEAKAAGTRETALDLAEPTCAALVERLAEEYPMLRPLLGTCRFAINHEFVDMSYKIEPGDEIALIGMVSGG